MQDDLAAQQRPSNPTVHLACDGCGGYDHSLPAGAAAALSAAERVKAMHAAGCARCAAWRHREADPVTGHCLLWWDVDAGDWLLTVPFPGLAGGVTLPLGLPDAEAVERAHVAAQMLMGDSPLAVGVAKAGAGVDRERVTLHEGGVRWSLWLPCWSCSGVDIPLRTWLTAPVEEAAREALDCVQWWAVDGCPRCRTRAERATLGPGGGPLGAWYDTDRGDWMGRVPVGSHGQRVAPLGLGRYSAPQEEVRQALADLLDDSALA